MAEFLDGRVVSAVEGAQAIKEIMEGMKAMAFEAELTVPIIVADEAEVDEDEDPLVPSYSKEHRGELVGDKLPHLPNLPHSKRTSANTSLSSERRHCWRSTR